MKVDQWSSGDWGWGTDGERWEGGITKAHEQVLAGNEYVLYLDGSNGFMGSYLCQSLSNDML